LARLLLIPSGVHEAIATIEDPNPPRARPGPLARLALACVLGASGCAGAIDDPAPFFAARSDGGQISGPDASWAALDGAPAAAADGSPAGSPLLLLPLVEERCASCHGAAGAADLDLVSPGLRERLVGVAATTCDEKLLVGSASADGFFLEKLGAEPACGARMPIGSAAFSARELEAVRQWLSGLIAAGQRSSSTADAGTSLPDAEALSTPGLP
jgi:mono/diheme cytochrome c family protein